MNSNEIYRQMSETRVKCKTNRFLSDDMSAKRGKQCPKRGKQCVKTRQMSAKSDKNFMKTNEKLMKLRPEVVKKKKTMAVKEEPMDEVVKEDKHVVKDEEEVVEDDKHVIKDTKHVVKDVKHVVKDDKQVVKDEEQVVKDEEQVVKDEEQVVKDEEQVVKDEEQVVKDDKQVVKDEEQVVKDDKQVVKDEEQVVKDEEQVVKDAEEECVQQFICYSNDCNQSFDDLNDLFRHLETKHNRFECEKCYESYTSRGQLSEHMKSAHRNSSQLFKCTFCSLKCLSESGLKLHIRSHAKHCVDNWRALKANEKTVGTPRPAVPHTFPCRKCGQEYTHENRLILHVNKVHNKCLKCPKWFQSEELLREHRDLVHNGCGSGANTSREPLERKAGEEDIECKTAAASVDRHSSEGKTSFDDNKDTKCMVKSVANVSGSDPTAKSVTAICAGTDPTAKSVTQSPQFIQTMRLTDFVCHECVQSFVSQNELSKHLGFVHKMSVFGCDSCDFRSNSYAGLTSHKSSHSQDRPFVCRHCYQSFKGENHLFRHIKTVHSFAQPLM